MYVIWKMYAVVISESALLADIIIRMILAWKSIRVNVQLTFRYNLLSQAHITQFVPVQLSRGLWFSRSVCSIALRMPMFSFSSEVEVQSYSIESENLACEVAVGRLLRGPRVVAFCTSLRTQTHQYSECEIQQVQSWHPTCHALPQYGDPKGSQVLHQRHLITQKSVVRYKYVRVWVGAVSPGAAEGTQRAPSTEPFEACARSCSETIERVRVLTS